MPLAARLLALFLSLAGLSGPASAQTAPGPSTGELLYLPIYSHIWHGDPNNRGEPRKTLVSTSVSIRNTDSARAIRILSAQYFDTAGRKLKEYVPSPRVVQPMGTFELFVPRSDDTGGSGASFLISWSSEQLVSPPIVEGIHVDLPGGTSLVFTTFARAIPRPPS